MKLSHKKIGINALAISAAPSGGRTYLSNILPQLLENKPEDMKFLVICGSKTKNYLAQYREALDFLVIPFADKAIFRLVCEQVIFPILLPFYRIDLLICLRNVIPIFSSVPTIALIMSMHLNYQYYNMNEFKRKFGMKLLSETAKKAKALVAISNFSKETFIAMFPVRTAIFNVGYLGIDSELAANVNAKQNMSGLRSRDYFLFVGTLFEHKNVDFLISLMSDLQQLDIIYPLYIVGRDVNGNMEKLKQLSRDHGIEDRVVFLGDVEETELARYYLNAKLFLFPSSIEGFGLPVIEAMKFGIPVIANKAASLPEVVSSGGFVLPISSPESWVNKIANLIEDESQYSRYSQGAKTNASLFDWKKTANVLLESIDEVMASNSRKKKA